MSEDNNEIFVDAEAYTGKEEFSFKELIMRHLAKISQICSCEFRAGYWQRRPVTLAGGVAMTEVYVEDKRDAYINAVDFLYDMLLPYFDKTMNQETEVLEQELAEAQKRYVDKGKSVTEWTNHKLSHKRRLFQKISLLLKRLGYLEQKTRTE